MTFDEIIAQLATQQAEAIEVGRQQERRRVQLQSPVTEAELRRLVLRDPDPAPEIMARLGAALDEHRRALAELLHAVEHQGRPVDVLGWAAVQRARALLLMSAAPTPPPAPRRPALLLVDTSKEHAP